MLQAAHRNLLKLHAVPAAWAQNASAMHNADVAQEAYVFVLQTARRSRRKLHAAPAGWAEHAHAHSQ